LARRGADHAGAVTWRAGLRVGRGREEDGPGGAGPSRREEKVWRADLRVGRGREEDGPGGAGPSRRCDCALEGRPPRRPIKTWRHGRLARRRGRFKSGRRRWM